MVFLRYTGGMHITKDFVGPADNLDVKRAPREDKSVAKQHNYLRSAWKNVGMYSLPNLTWLINRESVWSKCYIVKKPIVCVWFSLHCPVLRFPSRKSSPFEPTPTVCVTVWNYMIAQAIKGNVYSLQNSIRRRGRENKLCSNVLLYFLSLALNELLKVKWNFCTGWFGMICHSINHMLHISDCDSRSAYFPF